MCYKPGMPTGDSLSVFTGLLFFAAGTAVTAYTVAGAKARNLWIVAALFAVAAVAWLALPLGMLGSPTRILQWLILLTPLLTVSLVAVLLRDRSAPPSSAAPVERGEAGPPEDDANRRHVAVLVEMNRTASSVGYALGEGSKRMMESALPGLEATLIGTKMVPPAEQLELSPQQREFVEIFS